ncbi:MAG: hypothetical protein ICV60_02205 [Pyrinomonadaceae bacterium]|nr:hypothetical protein [Pyrinomonadaceae bacterium]
MATLTELRDAIDNLLNLPATSSLLQLNSNTCERAYETYIFSLCVEAVKRAGGQVTLVGIQTGNNPSTLVFRGAPGSMASRDQDFCYASCTVGNKDFEIHVDVEYEGHSSATHEIDVSICDARHCNSVRVTRRLPKTGKNLIMLFECKFYSSTPGVSLARTFVGLRSDCSQYQLSGFVSNITTQNLRSYLSKKDRPKPFTTIPLNSDSEELFIRNVEQELRRWARV